MTDKPVWVIRTSQGIPFTVYEFSNHDDALEWAKQHNSDLENVVEGIYAQVVTNHVKVTRKNAQ